MQDDAQAKTTFAHSRYCSAAQQLLQPGTDMVDLVDVPER
jgi:hypothetical protein